MLSSQGVLSPLPPAVADEFSSSGNGNTPWLPVDAPGEVEEGSRSPGGGAGGSSAGSIGPSMGGGGGGHGLLFVFRF